MTDYQFQTTPKDHQLSEFLAHRDDKSRGLLWEMGTGKSKEVIDQSAWLYQRGEINGMLIVAPGGVHGNWIINEIPFHLPAALLERTRMHTYSTKKAGNKGHKTLVDGVLNHDGLAILAMSYDAMVTDKGKRAAWEFLKRRKTMYIADEARRIKSPTADRTKAVVKSSTFAPYKRLLNGTPVPNGPFDVYSQMLFLDPDFWKPLGISTFSAFKVFFGVFITGYCKTPNGVREYPQLVSYKNLDVLHKHLDRMCGRVLKEDVLDLPEKIYSRMEFDLNPDQKLVYDQIAEEFMAVLADGNLVTAPLALTRLLRLQQVTSGFVPVDTLDDDHHFVDLGKTNPRLEMLEADCKACTEKRIIWCRFRRSIDKIMDIFGKEAVRYDGSTNEDDRVTAINAIQKGDAKYFVANAATAGEGLTLTAAKHSDYYENTFNLAERLQSEDRNHRIGQDKNVGYKDYVARKTVDEHVVKCLQRKLDVAAEITGDKPRFLGGMTADQLGISGDSDMADLARTVVQDVVGMFMHKA